MDQVATFWSLSWSQHGSDLNCKSSTGLVVLEVVLVFIVKFALHDNCEEGAFFYNSSA